MLRIKFHTVFYYFFIILMYNLKFSFCQSSDIEVNKNEDEKVTTDLVKKIVQKVGNITLETLANSNHKEKEHLVRKIEEKLYKSASNLPNGDKYARLLMKGVRLVAYKDSRKSGVVPPIVVPANTDNELIPIPEGSSKSELVKNIAKKVEIIANAFAKSKDTRDQKRAIQEIKNIVDSSASRKHKQLHNKHQQVKNYTELITKGIEQAMQKIARKNSKNLVIADNYFHSKTNNDAKMARVINYPIIEERRANKPNRLKPNTLLSDGIKEVDCTEMRIVLCNNINSLNVLQCPSDNTELAISKLCDGVIDCTDNSDERDCADKVISIVRNATNLVMKIEASMNLHCYPNSVEDKIVSQQNEVLRKVLEIQMKFIENHSNDNFTARSYTVNNPENFNTIRKTVNELVVVIDVLSSALKTTLCPNPQSFRKFNAEEIINNEIDIEENQDSVIDQLPEEKSTPALSLEKCVCRGGYCKGLYCNQECMVFCMQKYTLGRWQCDAVGEGDSVAIDVICDGKLDCFDESDEEGCVDGFGFAKFEAHSMFEGMQDLLIAKIKSEHNEAVRNRVINLSNLLKTLHGEIIKRKPEVDDIKRIRENVFSEMAEILEESRKTKTLEEVTSLYIELLSWNVKLVKVLMKTHTGNERIISPDGCFCTGNKCTQPVCSKLCIRACSAETLLTRYYCEDSPQYEDSIPTTAICNGTAECQGKDDERDCSKEGCRIHHLVVLRRNIQKVGDSFKGTSLGEALRSWKIKVNASLKIAESGGRPTLKIIREVIRVMLRDLVMAYAGLEEKIRKGNTDHILDEFIRISRIIFESLRSCAY